MRELIIDLFAGGGGASEGIEQALCVPVDLAINHDPEAIRMHWLNHPKTRHITEDVWKINPHAVTKGVPVGLLWASPDCTHHSRAKGGKPRSGKRRSLADVIIDWAKMVNKPRIIMLENVTEFEDWGPLDEVGQPIKELKGQDFKRWVSEITEQGYVVEWRRLVACDYGVPTDRERFFLIARCDGHPIVWPDATHGPGLIPYRSAAECIDFSLPCPSIFMQTKEAWDLYRARRPLKENTLRRIAAGLRKYIIESKDPFVVNDRACFLTKYHGDRGEKSDGRGQVLTKPLLTQDTQNRFGLVSAWLLKYYGTNIGSDFRLPLPTVTGQGNHLAAVYAFLISYYGNGIGQNIYNPLRTITTKERFGLVTINGIDYQITDIGLRMLTPSELLKAMGFRDDYVLVGDKTTMVAKIGNSVPPEMARQLVSVNVVLKNIGSEKVA